MKPLQAFPTLQSFVFSFLRDPFDSVTALSKTTSPTLLLHAVDDLTIPHIHSSRLFSALHQNFQANSSGIETLTYDGWGKVSWFQRDGKGEVIWWEGLSGGHTRVEYQEGSQDLIRRVAGLP